MGTINFSSINNSFNHNLTTIDSSNTLNTNTITDDSQKYWGQNKIELNKALEISNPIKTIKIGVLDTGIDYQHEILKSLYNTTLSKSYFHTASFGILTDDSKKGHGTHVAGIIASITNYTNIELISYKVMDPYGNGNYKNQIDAIKQATKDEIDILNISSSGKDDRYFSVVSSLTDAISNFNGLVICSAGNDILNLDHSSGDYKRYPACIYSDNVITVGASSYDDLKSDYSNYGKSSVDLFAPGDNIYSCVPTRVDKSGYKFDSGTSMSTPMVTGVAALLLSNNPSLTTSELKDAILSSVDKIDALEDKCVTGGRLNAYKALMEIHEHKYSYTIVGNYHNSSCICGDTHIEDHTYNKWLYKNNLSHIEACVCNKVGAKTSVHIVKQSSIIGNTSICIDCNTKLNLKSDIGMVEGDIVHVTLNGSYKLPNGIIVLSDIDYNSYINGTLSFNYNDDMLLS